MTSENHENAEDFIQLIKKLLGKEKSHTLQINHDYNKPYPIGENTVLFRKCLYKDMTTQIISDNLFNETMKRIFSDFSPEPDLFKVCGGPFSHIAVDFEGNVFPCCVENKKDFSLGNIFREDIADIINSEKMRKVRQFVLGDDINNVVLPCSKCRKQVFPVYYENDKDYLRSL